MSEAHRSKGKVLIQVQRGCLSIDNKGHKAATRPLSSHQRLCLQDPRRKSQGGMKDHSLVNHSLKAISKTLLFHP